MAIPTLKDRWSDRPALGAWMFLREPMTAEAAARIGYDYVVVDLQHGIASEPEALAMMQAAEAAGAIPVARVSTNHPMAIGRALDAGALAVIVPMVNDAEGARSAVSASRYAPEGSRSYGPVAAVSRYSDDYARVANRTVACIVMIETVEALENLDEILAVPGVDAVYVGPVDLSLTLGLPPETDHDDARFTDAIDRILAACERHGVVPGIHADPTLAAKWTARGFRMITVGYDQFSVLSGLRGDLATARDGGGGGVGDGTARGAGYP
jgi:4-hydroxy-2-oxoheptanedioate aldolase